MKVVLVGQDEEGGQSLNTEQVRSRLVGGGSHYKFIIMVFVDVMKEEFFFVLSLGGSGVRHERLARHAIKVRNEMGLCGVGDGFPRGGGSVEVEDDKIIFFDKSGDFGAYDRDLIRKVSTQLLELLGLREIEFLSV